MEHPRNTFFIDDVPPVEREIENPDEVSRRSLAALRERQFAMMKNFDGNVADDVDDTLKTNADIEVLFSGIDRLTKDLELSTEDKTALWEYARAATDVERQDIFSSMSPQAKDIAGEYWQMVKNYFAGDFGRYSRSANV